MRGSASLQGDTTRFSLWAPDARRVRLLLEAPARGTGPRGTGQRSVREYELSKDDEGWHALSLPRSPPQTAPSGSPANASANLPGAGAGTRYRYCIDDEQLVPDPMSRFNPQGVQGPSEVIDPLDFEWTDDEWRGRPWHEAVLYELHVGTFTPEGTFDAIIPRLETLRGIGITAIQLMPVGAFAGHHGWGYDGVLPFAPHAAYGRPDGFKRLVQAAHAAGLMVILDVIYNHFGPEGNYLPRYASAFFTRRRDTPWGQALDFRCTQLRRYFIDNALYWLQEYRVDGLRLDAVHEIVDDSRVHFVDELATRIAAGPGSARHVHLILENAANEASRLRSRPHVSLSQWNDDFHHAAHTLLTAESDSYYINYQRSPRAHLGRVLTEGFAFQGESFVGHVNGPRGEPSAHLPTVAFVNFLQNHDQIGNRALGERLTQLVQEAPLRALTAMLLLSPAVPLMFMGEEYAATQPFLYFCDHSGELGLTILAGRRAEFANSRDFAALASRIPDPNDPATFRRSRLHWQDRDKGAHRRWLDFVKSLLAVRQRYVTPRVMSLQPGTARWDLHETVLSVLWPVKDGTGLLLRANLADRSCSAAWTAPWPRTGPGPHVHPTWIGLPSGSGVASAPRSSAGSDVWTDGGADVWADVGDAGTDAGPAVESAVEPTHAASAAHGPGGCVFCIHDIDAPLMPAWDVRLSLLGPLNS